MCHAFFSRPPLQVKMKCTDTWDWGDDSVGKALAAQTEGPKFDLPEPKQKPRAANSSTWEDREDDGWGLLASLP